MIRPLFALSLLLLTTAQAHQIGGVTIAPATPRPVTTPAQVPAGIPADWYQIRGNVSASSRVSLPKGSTVSIVMKNRTLSSQMVRVVFRNSALPTNYYMAINPIRINSTHQYTLQATVTAPSGKVLYRSHEVILPKNAHVVDLTVR